MRIERVHIAGFGRLVNRTYEFPEGRAVLVLEDNESGKSTLAAAILACMCGFPSRKQAGEKVKLLDAYRPWSGDVYRVEMDLTAGGRSYRVERDFGRGTFVVRDPETNREITAQCESDLAKQFLLLPREDFARVAFVSGKEVHHFGSSANIQARLSALVDGAQDEAGCDLAIAALEETGYILGGRQIKIDTATKRLGEEIAAKEVALRELDAGMESAGEDAARLDAASGRQRELTDALARLDLEYGSAKLREVLERIEAARSNEGDAERLAAELAELEEYATFPAERRGQLDGAVARADERRKHAEDLRAKCEALERQADEIGERLESSGQLGNAGEGDADTLVACSISLKNAMEACSGRREAVALERRALAAEGIDTDAVRDSWRRFERLSQADREFVRRGRERELELTAAERAAEAEIAEGTARLGDIKRNGARVGGIGKLMAAAGGLLGMAAVVLMVMRTIGIGASVALAGLGVVIATAGLVRLIKAGGLDADEKARLEIVVSSAHDRIEKIRAERELDQRRLMEISKAAEYGGPAELMDGLRECERSVVRSDSLNSLTAQLAQAEESLQSAQERAMLVLRRLGVSAEPAGLQDALERTREALLSFAADRDRLAGTERELVQLNREIEKTRSGAEEEIGIARTILEDAGVDPNLPLEEAMREFTEREKRYRRYREIRDSLLPAARRHVAPDSALEALTAEEDELVRAGASGTASGRTSGEVDGERRAVRDELDAVSGEVRELEKRVGGCVDRYRAEYPALREDLERLQREMAKASRFGEAVRTAADVLREVSRESRRRWAVALNDRATAILPHLNDDYDTLRFDDSLSFTVRHIADNRVIQKDEIDACLSTGAKDQVYLAVRLACCGELSRSGEGVPIVLDDPLMAADDTRFRSGLEYLIRELAETNQVIILSCHKSRHSRLLAEPGLAESCTVLTL